MSQAQTEALAPIPAAISTPISTEEWLPATWQDYLAILAAPTYQNAKTYYYNDRLRIEMAPVGYDHSSDNNVISFAISLFASLKGIPLNGLINCSFRKPEIHECQPDLAYYLGESAQAIPRGTGIVDLGRYTPPQLAIEIANTSLSEDLGQKRLMYEEMGVSEYWVVDVQKAQVIALAVENQGSKRITQSQVLPGLAIALLEEALRRSRQIDQAQVGAWLLTQLQQ
ncbi:Uma2 family endonuclease [Leptolyngbya sp. FACHB-261]|uniref:Uma2 family endonuclease n=1 Tax=Leptolyngbya sp. FACHB-261 TaxID=2692806 RepID=UPI0016886C5E|nr:Uma2 family endonuclease [Leptolyngbya sp. FACHB-261]MBD2102054.1 Uma2 family endonuclease [Leptolyngbya sp. FACHB-261]